MVIRSFSLSRPFVEVRTYEKFVIIPLRFIITNFSKSVMGKPPQPPSTPKNTKYLRRVIEK